MALIITFDDPTGLAKNIANQLHSELIHCKKTTFCDGEVHVSLEDPSQFKDQVVIVVHSMSAPVNDNTLRVAFLAHELKNAGAQKVVGVIPYLGYGRQEVSKSTGKKGHAFVVMRMLQQAGFDELFTCEIHEPMVQDFVSIPVHNILVRERIAQHIKDTFDTRDMCIVAPDEGARAMAHQIAHPLGVHTMVFQKERYAVNKTRVVGQSGQCKGTTAIIIDDIIDTGGTAMRVCDELKQQGFKSVIGYFVHPVLSNNAAETLQKSGFNHVFVSNSISISHIEKVGVFDVSETVAQCVNASLASLFFSTHSTIQTLQKG